MNVIRYHQLVRNYADSDVKIFVRFTGLTLRGGGNSDKITKNVFRKTNTEGESGDDMKERATRNRWLRDLLCGALIGAGAILPGVSGGVLAVVFDVYRPAMETLTHPVQGIQRYWRIFLPLGIGGMIGFLGLARGITAAYDLSAAATCWLFIGLIAGTFPALWREAGREGRGIAAWISCAVCALTVFGTLFYLRHILHMEVEPNFWWYNFCGALWGASVVIPGLTSSAIMMALGLYEPMIQGLAELQIPMLASCVPGMLLAMLLLARLVTWLFREHYAVIFHGILGIVAAATLTIIPVSYRGWGEGLASVLCCAAGFALAFFLERLNRTVSRS